MMFKGAIAAGTGPKFTEIPADVMFPTTVTGGMGAATGTTKAMDDPPSAVGPCTRFPRAITDWAATSTTKVGLVLPEGSSRKHWLLLKMQDCNATATAVLGCGG